ncbi:unnamed protein product [Effrenium voratum]|nr:unnamed protein product [Effrenium voratum]
MTMEAWYEIYKMWADGSALPEDEIAKVRTFSTTYESIWKPILQMRTVSQHARCTLCAEFTARCRKECFQHLRAQIERAQTEHLKNVRQYRQIQSRLNCLSEMATSGDGADEAASILKLDLDGLDQNKTRYPRNLSSAKSLSNCWRPQAHMLCCIVWGVLEAYYVLEPDIPKDSSTEVTVIMKALDAAAAILTSKGVRMPEHLIIETDNCPREGKNQIVAKVSATAIITGRFRSVTHIFGQVGHTHGPVDQRLSVAVAAFQAMDVIQTPEDFVQCVLEKVKPARGRQLAAELLQGSLNWKEYYEQYGLSVGGLVPNAHRPDDSVNHCWRFIRRSDLPLYDAQSGESWAPAEICEDSGLDQSNNL